MKTFKHVSLRHCRAAQSYQSQLQNGSRCSNFGENEQKVSFPPSTFAAVLLRAFLYSFSYRKEIRLEMDALLQYTAVFPPSSTFRWLAQAFKALVHFFKHPAPFLHYTEYLDTQFSAVTYIRTQSTSKSKLQHWLSPHQDEQSGLKAIKDVTTLCLSMKHYQQQPPLTPHQMFQRSCWTIWKAWDKPCKTMPAFVSQAIKALRKRNSFYFCAE